MDQNWKVAQKTEEQEWANENPRLDNARRMRDTYFLDPRQGLARRMAHSTAMLFKQTCHPSHLFHDFEPTAEFLDRLPRRSPGLALRTDQSNQRPTDQVADLVVAPKTRTWFCSQLAGLAPQRPLACDLRTRVFCFVTDSSLAENFYVITQHHCTVLLNNDTFTRDFPCTPIHVVCSPAVEGMVVAGKFRRASDPSNPHFTVANVHINNEFAKRRSVCIALLLLIRDLCMELFAVILTGDFKKGAERELASSATTDQRRISPLEFAFSCACCQLVELRHCWAAAESFTAACVAARMLRFCRAPSIAKPMVKLCATGPSTSSLRPLG